MSEPAREVVSDGDHSAVLSRLLVGRSLEMHRVRALVLRLAPLDLSVLIVGPSGAGKELVARGLHLMSGRRARLVALNVSEIPSGLFSDSLFGHVRGAFTGALQDRSGYLQEADGGTLFLDEVGSLSLEHQVALLRAIELKEFRPVGARANTRSAFRVVAATNESLDKLVVARRFRFDLLERLRGATIRVPSLSHRLEDVPDLAQHLLRNDPMWSGAAWCTPGALALLQQHSWPGNVRELQHVLRRAAALASAPQLTDRDIAGALANTSEVVVDGHGAAEEARGIPSAQQLRVILAEAEGDTGRAARTLGVSRSTLYRWLHLLHLATPRRRRAESCLVGDEGVRPRRISLS